MQLFAVREKKSKQPVGFFWAKRIADFQQRLTDFRQCRFLHLPSEGEKLEYLPIKAAGFVQVGPMADFRMGFKVSESEDRAYRYNMALVAPGTVFKDDDRKCRMSVRGEFHGALADVVDGARHIGGWQDVPVKIKKRAAR